MASVIPEKCPKCGARDVDVQAIGWFSASDGVRSYHLTDTAMDDFPLAGAHCPSCGHDWEMDWRSDPL